MLKKIFIILILIFVANANPLFNYETFQDKINKIKNRNINKEQLPFGSIKRSRNLTINFSLLSDFRNNRVSKRNITISNDEILLNIFDDTEIIFVVTKIEQMLITGESVKVFSGYIKDDNQSGVTLSYIENKKIINANINSAKFGSFHIKTNNSGETLIEEIEFDKFEEGNDTAQMSQELYDDVSKYYNIKKDDKEQNTNQTDDKNKKKDDIHTIEWRNKTVIKKRAASTIIDVMMVYTTQANGVTNAPTAIATAISEANQAYANSGVDMEVRLVHSANLDFTAIDETNGAGFSNSLTAITATADGEMDTIHTLRTTYGADVVGLFINNANSCGLAWTMNSGSTPATFGATNGFSVTYISCVSNRSFAHEVGHNMGLLHDREQSYDDNGGIDPATKFSSQAFGHIELVKNWRTIMSYNTHCTTPGTCTRLNYFSNPNINYNDGSGDAATGTNVADAKGNTAYNANILETNKATYAAWVATATGTSSSGGGSGGGGSSGKSSKDTEGPSPVTKYNIKEISSETYHITWEGSWGNSTYFLILYKGQLALSTAKGAREATVNIGSLSSRALRSISTRASSDFTICSVDETGNSCDSIPISKTVLLLLIFSISIVVYHKEAINAKLFR